MQRQSSRRRPNFATAQAAATTFVRKHRPDYSIVTYMAILVVIGLIIIFSISPQHANVMNESVGSDVSGFYFIFKQVINVLAAVGAFIITAVIVPFEWLRKYAFKIFLAGIAACALLFILGNILHVNSVAQCALGACRWFSIPGFGTLQPAELLKFGLLLYLPGFLAVRMKNNQLDDHFKTTIPVVAMLFISEFFIVILQKDLGTGAALLAIVVAMIVATNISVKKLAMLFLAIVILAVTVIAIAPHRMKRVATFLQTDEQMMNDPNSYHIVHAKIAIGSGGLAGVGIGNSVQAAGYLPEAINDSVFAILGETFGFLGLVFILTMFCLLLLRLLAIAGALQDDTYRFVVVGVFGWIASHVFINVGSMTALIPLTGITLPFLSFGGTSILFIALALGLVFQLSRYTSHNITKEKSYEGPRSGGRVGRSRHTSRRRTI